MGEFIIQIALCPWKCTDWEQSNLIETASSKTGSFIIWDTGEYEILPYHQEQSLSETDDSKSQVSDDHDPKATTSDSAKLREAFQNVCVYVL